MLIVNFEFSRLSKNNWLSTLSDKQCIIKSPNDFTHVEQLESNQNVLIWMVNAESELPALLNHWNEHANASKFLSECYVATKAWARSQEVKQFPLVHTLPKGTPMVDILTGTDKPRGLGYGIAIRQVIPQTQQLRGKSLSPNGKTLCFRGRIHYTHGVVLFDT
jgi:hypothetical protein